ncbi:hypothetical protein Hdeb2414_s0011g00360171 [Helianthus debilis subsp. tardiflorus]
MGQTSITKVTSKLPGLWGIAWQLTLFALLFLVVVMAAATSYKV